MHPYLRNACVKRLTCAHLSEPWPPWTPRFHNMLPVRSSGSETRMTLWALSAAEAFSELRADLCSQSHAIVLILDADSARLSEQMQQLQRLMQSAQVHAQPSHNPALFLVAAVSAQ